MRDWRQAPTRGRPIATIMGQVFGDAATRDVDLAAWQAEIARVLKAQGYEVHFRPHPVDVRKERVKVPPGAILRPTCEPIDTALAATDFAITFNSTSGVEAALAGIPVHAADEGSPAWPVASRDLRPRRPDRGAWASRLAWAQWTIEEFRSGYAWEHVRPLALTPRKRTR